MITLSCIIIFGSTAGWCVRFLNWRKGKYRLNPLEEDATFPAFMLLIGTAISVIISLIACIKYLP